MPKSYLVIIGIVVFALAYVIIEKLYFAHPQTNLETLDVKIKDTSYTLEIARTTRSQAIGLSNRKSLCSNCGMIFVFDQESSHPFWMKNTLIPLDMIWLDHQGKVVTILQATPEPGVSDLKLKQYINNAPAIYVIELNSGDSDKIDLKVGDFIDLSSLK
jgi:hypothetical protein